MPTVSAQQVSTPAMTWRVMYIEVDLCFGVDFEDVFVEDRGALGAYKVLVPAHMDDKTAAACAMGCYHSTVPIKYLGLFEYVVCNEEGIEVELDDDLDWYELAEQCGEIHCYPC